LQKVNGNVYIVNTNSGNIQTQINLSDCLVEMYRQGVGLFGMIARCRRLYIGLAMADCKTHKQAARKLKVSEHTVWSAVQENKLLPYEAGE